MDKNVYIGARYVPLLMGDWDQNIEYEPLSIVQYQGASYTSKQFVPKKIELTNDTYWVKTGDYNAQIAYYESKVDNLTDIINQSGIKRLMATGKFETNENSYIALINTKYQGDKATRFYLVPRETINSGVGGCLKIFGDNYLNNTDYRDLGIYFSADQENERGYYGNGAFFINGKVLEGSKYDGKNPDIIFSFQDAKVIAGRFVKFTDNDTVFVIGNEKPKSHISGTRCSLEVQGNVAITNNKVLRFMSTDNSIASGIYLNEENNLIESLSGNKITYKSGEELFSTSEKGFVFNKGSITIKSPNGTKYTLKVDNEGNLSTEPYAQASE